MSRPPLRAPISLAVLLIPIVVLLIVGWVIMTVGRRTDGNLPLQNDVTWTLQLVSGVVLLVLVLVGVVIYLILSIKAINLTRRQSNFIDSVTHELKSPIASLKLYLQTLSRRPVSQEEQAEFYQFMLEDVERLDLLINHILSAARLDRNLVDTETERIDLPTLLTACVREVCARHRVSQDVVNVDLMPCSVVANRVDLGLIFRNLIDNAVKYADDKAPEVRVSAEFVPEQGSALVQVSDNGPGIPGPFRNKVFARFVRLGTELERKKPGTGLGLYIVRTLLQRWKGSVMVKGRDGGGTTFQVTLPNATTHPDSASRSQKIDPLPAKAG